MEKIIRVKQCLRDAMVTAQNCQIDRERMISKESQLDEAITFLKTKDSSRESRIQVDFWIKIYNSRQMVNEESFV